MKIIFNLGDHDMTRKIFHILFPTLFWPYPISMMLWFKQQPKYPLFEKVKVFPKIMCFQKYGDLYAISYLFFNLDGLHVFTTPIL